MNILDISLQLLLGAAGGFLAQIVDVINKRKEGKPVNTTLVAIIIVFSGIMTFCYFSFIEKSMPGAAILLNYGLFIALIIEESMKINSRIPTTTPSRAMLFFVISPSGIILLSGFPEVFGGGCIGGILAEVLVQYNKRTLTSKPHTILFWINYSIWTIGMILAGGIVAAAQGVVNVSLLLALQLGASAPLLISRFRR